MKEVSGRWQRRIWAARVGSRRERLQDISSHTTGTSAPEPTPPTPVTLPARIQRAAFAFRGYDIANLGRSAELLAHERFGPIVRTVLNEVSALASDVLGRHIDVAARVAAEQESSLETFPEDVALIVGMGLAQLRLLEDLFGIAYSKGQLAIGYSIGELTAMIAGGVYTLDQLLPVP